MWWNAQNWQRLGLHLFKLHDSQLQQPGSHRQWWWLQPFSLASLPPQAIAVAQVYSQDLCMHTLTLNRNTWSKVAYGTNTPQRLSAMRLRHRYHNKHDQEAKYTPPTLIVEVYPCMCQHLLTMMILSWNWSKNDLHVEWHQHFIQSLSLPWVLVCGTEILPVLTAG